MTARRRACSQSPCTAPWSARTYATACASPSTTEVPPEPLGALTGGLLGALHGETALPPAWLAELEGRPTILVLADDFALEMTQGPALHAPGGAVPGWLTRYPRA